MGRSVTPDDKFTEFVNLLNKQFNDILERSVLSSNGQAYLRTHFHNAVAITFKDLEENDKDITDDVFQKISDRVAIYLTQLVHEMEDEELDLSLGVIHKVKNLFP